MLLQAPDLGKVGGDHSLPRARVVLGTVPVPETLSHLQLETKDSAVVVWWPAGTLV